MKSFKNFKNLKGENMKKLLIVVLFGVMLIIGSGNYETNKILGYSQEEIDYFCELAFYGFGITKWGTKDIGIIIHENEYKEFVQNYIKEINFLTGLNLSLGYKRRNIKINFEKMSNNSWGETEIHIHHYITRADILIKEDLELSKQHTALMHEIAHSIGLMSHVQDYTSILCAYFNNSTNINHLDRIAIEILYLKEIKAGMSESEVRSLFIIEE